MANEKLATISIHSSRERDRQRTYPHTNLIMIMTFKLKCLYCRRLQACFKVVDWTLWVLAKKLFLCITMQLVEWLLELCLLMSK